MPTTVAVVHQNRSTAASHGSNFGKSCPTRGTVVGGHSNRAAFVAVAVSSNSRGFQLVLRPHVADVLIDPPARRSDPNFWMTAGSSSWPCLLQQLHQMAVAGKKRQGFDPARSFAIVMAMARWVLAHARLGPNSSRFWPASSQVVLRAVPAAPANAWPRILLLSKPSSPFLPGQMSLPQEALVAVPADGDPPPARRGHRGNLPGSTLGLSLLSEAAASGAAENRASLSCLKGSSGRAASPPESGHRGGGAS